MIQRYYIYYPLFENVIIKNYFIENYLFFINKERKKAMLNIALFIIRYIYPRFFSVFLNYVIWLLPNNIVFLRLNLDHYGPIIYPFLFFSSKDYINENKYFILSKDFPNDEIIKLFPKNFVFITRPWMWLFMGPLFFTKRSKKIFPSFDFHIRKKPDKLQSDFEPLSRESIQLKKFQTLNIKYEINNELKEKIGSNKFIVLYNREIGWMQSAGNSLRNISLDRFKRFLYECRSHNIRVIRFGGNYLTPAINYGIDDSYLFDFATSNYATSYNEICILSNCEAIVGSPSGAIHVPSLFFSKPTLYIGHNPITTLISWHGLLHRSGKFPIRNLWFLPEVLGKRGDIMDINSRLKYEFSSANNYSDCIVNYPNNDLICKLGINFLNKLRIIKEENKNMPDYLPNRYNIYSNGKYNESSFSILKDENGPILL